MSRALIRQREREARRLANDKVLQREVAKRVQQQQQDAMRREAQARRNEAAQPLAEEQVRDLLIYAIQSVASVGSGEAIESDLHNIACMSNVSMLLAEWGLGDEYLDDIRAGQDAVVSMMARHERVGRVGASGPELVALRRLLEIHEAQLESGITRGEMVSALNEIRRRMSTGQVLETATENERRKAKREAA